MIDAIRPYPILPGRVRLTRFGGTGLLLRTSVTAVLVDLYLGGDAAPGWTRACPIPFALDDLAHMGRLDALLSTHEHLDHCYPPLIDWVGRHTDALFIGPSRSVAIARAAGFPVDRLHSVRSGNVHRVGDVTVNVHEFNDPGSPESLGYVFTTEGGTVFHAGDVTWDPKLRDMGDRYDVDVAFMSLAQRTQTFRGHMNVEEMARAAMAVRPHRLVPMHYDLWEVVQEDPRLVAKALAALESPIQVVILDQGASLWIPDAADG